MKHFLGSVNSRDRSTDPFHQLRSTLENVIPCRKSYSPFQIKADVLNALYNAFWGSHSNLLVPGATSSPTIPSFLSEVQGKPALTDPPMPGRSCGRVFQKGEVCYRCKNCALDDSSVMCSRCFRATQHEGHNITFYISHQAGGCCDCGDSESWRIRPNCPYHPPGIPNTNTNTTQRVPLGSTLSPVMDVWSSSKHPTRTSVPYELRESMARTIGYAVDYVLDTLTNSPDDIVPPHDEHELRTQETGDPFAKEVYAVVLWNDDKHSFEETINNVCEATGLPRCDIAEMVDRLDDEGREIVETSDDIMRLLDVGTRLHQIDLGVTIRRTFDTYREQISAVIIEWLLDLSRCRIGTDPFALRELITAELLNLRKRDISLSYNRPTEGSKSHSDDTFARLDWLFLYHTKLWKKPRLSLKQLYVSIITLGHEYKMVIASRFASIYHRVIETFLLIDRDGDTSVKYFALQLYTVPSVAAHVVRNHNLITRLLAIITAFSTEQINGTRIVFPPDPNQIVDPDSKAFKSKRFMPVFTDLRYICGNHTVQSLIVANADFISSFCKVCQMFMGINPNQRATDSHVEYESDTWINVFNVTLSLSRVVKAYGEAYSKATVAQLVDAIGIVIHNTMAICTLQENRLDRTKYRSVIPHIVEFNKNSYTVVKFDVLEGWVSFHHALHWLLAELFKHVNLLGSESLKTIGCPNLRSVLLRNSCELDVLTLVDFPLRVITMIAQIRAGLWVRNGFAIRGQLLHYRDFMLRELCYDQDLFILQSAFVILDPGLVLVSIMDRFQLLGWFSGAAESGVYDDNQLPSMVEEFLYVITTCLSESANARQLPMESAIRRELIHALAVGPCGFTEICKRVAERMVEEVCFEKVLMDVAHFRYPEGTTDSGLYELKEECFDEVNPYFYHYARNKREEVDSILKARAKKKTGSADMVYVPQPLNIKSGQFVTLTNAFQSSVLHQIIFFTIYNVSNNQGKMTSVFAEAILDQALHLVILGIVEQPQHFSRQCAHVAYEQAAKQTLIELLCSLEHKEIFKALKAKIQWCLDQFSQHVPCSVLEKRKIPDSPVKPPVEDAKKRAVKARQDAIMKQFATAQKNFLDSFEENDEDEEMEDGTEETASFQSYGPCIVCQEALDNTQPFGTLALVQASRLLRQAPDHSVRHLNEVIGSPLSLDCVADDDTHANREASKPGAPAATQTSDSMYGSFDAFPREFTRFGMHGSACGHMMHVACFSTYTAAIRQRHRVQAQRCHPENIHRKEFICPLCKSLGNVILPVVMPINVPLETQSFPDWVRTTGINLLRSTPDRLLESLHFKSGSGEFVFWTAQDSGYPPFPRHPERVDPADTHKMVDTMVVAARTISGQSRHLRDRVEQDPGDRGVGMYLPEELIGYTLASIETTLRGTPTLPGQTIADQLTEFQSLFLRGIVACLTKMAALQFKDRPDGGRETIRQAIVKRLLPEWRRETAFNSPLLLREPLTIVVEMAAVSPESLHYVTILAYYASLARLTIGIVQLLMKSQYVQLSTPSHEIRKDLFGDLGTFVMSVVRHSPLLEHSAELILEAFGEERFSKLLYHYSLPFLRRVALLRKAIRPASLSSTRLPDDLDEYGRLLRLLGIPSLATLSAYDTIQTALSGWCAHYGFLHTNHPMECGIILDYPLVYHLADLPYYLDDLFESENGEMLCLKCETVPQDPAICLVCGITVCFQSHCCVDMEKRERGECNMHTRECAGVIGAYFLPKRCAILYLFGGNGSFAPAPYLDVHGEIDFNMRRGRRQRLHNVRMEEIRKLWLNHGIPTYIARKMDATIDVGGWDSL